MARTIDTADCAKLIRKALKARWAGVKFSVRSKRYSGGSSITVYWTDGPTSDAVDSVVKRFSGASFDGMIDLKSYHDSVISHEDGSIESVHYDADYVFTSRSYSDEAKLAAAKEIAKAAEDCEYLDHSNDVSLDPSEIVNGHGWHLPVAIFKGNDGIPGCAIDRTRGNYASCLVREYCSLLDLYEGKAAAK